MPRPQLLRVRRRKTNRPQRIRRRSLDKSLERPLRSIISKERMKNPRTLTSMLPLQSAISVSSLVITRVIAHKSLQHMPLELKQLTRSSFRVSYVTIVTSNMVENYVTLPLKNWVSPYPQVLRRWGTRGKAKGRDPGIRSTKSLTRRTSKKEKMRSPRTDDSGQKM